jgi:Protein of unknown function (DUF3040)
VLNDRERRVLARIERELAASDPDLVRLFRSARPSRVSGPTLLLAVGLAVMVLGSALVSVPIAVLGMIVSCWALVAAYRAPIGFRPA